MDGIHRARLHSAGDSTKAARGGNYLGRTPNGFTTMMYSQIGPGSSGQRPSIHQTPSIQSDSRSSRISTETGPLRTNGIDANATNGEDHGTYDGSGSQADARKRPSQGRAMLAQWSPSEHSLDHFLHIHAGIRVLSEIPGLREIVKSPENCSYIRAVGGDLCGHRRNFTATNSLADFRSGSRRWSG